jgi:DNA-binding transcriptional LysR family regulator
VSEISVRRLQYFVAVAEELNFGRAAARLRIAQPVLSRQIAVLERELGVTLFDRSARGTALSAAGRTLLADVQAVLASADALERRAAGLARGGQRLAVGFMPGLVVSPLVQLLADRFPALDIEMVRTSWDDQVTMLRDGRIDLSLVRLPAAVQGLDTVPLLTEPRVAALPAGHPLAAQASLSLADLAGLDLLQDPAAVPEWRTERLRLGLPPAPPGGTPRPRAVEEKLEHVAAGRGIAVLPASTARFYHRPDVCYRPVDGLAANEVVLAWVPHRRSAAVEFAVRHADALRVSNQAKEVLDAGAASAPG